MTPETMAALLSVADELAGFHPVPSTMPKKPFDAASAAIQMAVELIRERANGEPGKARPATDAELGQRLSFSQEWYLDGLRHPPGDYVLMRVGPVTSDDVPF